VAGHFDHHNEGTILGYQLLPAETKAKSRLIVGAWNHSFVTTPTIHQPDALPNAGLIGFDYDPKNPVNIRSGITTLAFRNNRLGARQSYTPGEVVELQFEALPILWQVGQGHRLRIDISSSNFPEYAIHSNYAGVWSQQTKTRVAHQQIYLGKEHRSCIEIPVR